MKHQTIYRLFVLLALLASSATAHHSPANYNLTVTDFAVKGEISRVEFRNPHSKMTLLVAGANGQAQEWDIEFSSVNLLVRRGWQMDRIKVGTIVTCIGNPDKAGNHKMYMWSIKLADGTEFKK